MGNINNTYAVALMDAVYSDSDFTNFVQTIERSLENGYVNHQSEKKTGWSLNFKDFYVQLDAMQEITIGKLKKTTRRDIVLTDECIVPQRQCHLSLSLQCTLFCEATICSIIEEKYEQAAFEDYVTND